MPRTMTAEEEQEWVLAYALPDKPHWPGSRMYAELYAERTAHSQTIQAAEKLAKMLEEAADAYDPNIAPPNADRSILLRRWRAALAQYAAVRSGK